MYDYIRGALVELNPADVTIEAGGIGYHILFRHYLLQPAKRERRVSNSISTSIFAKMKSCFSDFLTRRSALCSVI